MGWQKQIRKYIPAIFHIHTHFRGSRLLRNSHVPICAGLSCFQLVLPVSKYYGSEIPLGCIVRCLIFYLADS